MSYVMISYCHKDGPFAGRLADALRANNCEVWFDDGIRVGDKFAHLIHNKINDAAAVLVVWSNSACASDWVRAEVLQAFDLGKPLIPVIKEPCAPLPVPFNLYQRIDLSNWTFEPSSSQIQKIVAALPTLNEPQIDDDPKPRTKLQEVAPFLQEKAQIKTIDRIAIGELSDVYRGEYGRRTLAIKAFPNSLLPTATQEALLAEVALASNLNHPAFLRISHVLFDGHVCFVVSDHVSGAATIARRIREQGAAAFSVNEVVDILNQLCESTVERRLQACVTSALLPPRYS